MKIPFIDQHKRNKEFVREFMKVVRRSRNMNDYELQAQLHCLKTKYPLEYEKFFKKAVK